MNHCICSVSPLGLIFETSISLQAGQPWLIFAENTPDVVREKQAAEGSRQQAAEGSNSGQQQCHIDQGRRTNQCIALCFFVRGLTLATSI